VKSDQITVDSHEKGKDFITEAELEELVKAAKSSRHQWRDTALLRVMFWHGLRVSELCNLRQSDLDFRSGQIHVRRIKGGLSTHHPLRGDELRTLRRYLKERANSAYPGHSLLNVVSSSPDSVSTTCCGPSRIGPRYPFMLTRICFDTAVDTP
jgi:integrase